jgi:hypothetical protein
MLLLPHTNPIVFGSVDHPDHYVKLEYGSYKEHQQLRTTIPKAGGSDK